MAHTPEESPSSEEPATDKEAVPSGFFKNPEAAQTWLCIISLVAAALMGGAGYYAEHYLK